MENGMLNADRNTLFNRFALPLLSRKEKKPAYGGQSDYVNTNCLGVRCKEHLHNKKGVAWPNGRLGPFYNKNQPTT